MAAERRQAARGGRGERRRRPAAGREAPGWHASVLELIGNTPMVRLRRLAPRNGALLLAKLEYTNPSGSLKDRIALQMIAQAERDGRLRRGGAVVEPTSGNTGAGAALVCALKGYPMVAVMPEAMTRERAALMAALGAVLRLTPCRLGKRPGTFGKEDIEGTIAEAERIAALPGFFMPNQFQNPGNPAAHQATAREIWRQTGGRVDAFIMGVGTSGTLTGVGRWLRRRNRRVRVVAVEPRGSAVLSGCEPGPHRLQGIGEGFVPPIYRDELVNEVIRVGDDDARTTACRLAREEGILAGYSGGANVWAAQRVARRLARRVRPRRVVVTMIPDTGLKYLSTDLYVPQPRLCRRCSGRRRCAALRRRARELLRRIERR